MQKSTIFCRLLWTVFLPYTLLKRKAKAKESDCVTFLAFALFSNRVTNNCSPLSKKNRNHCVKALVKKRGAACLPKKDAGDDISAFMSRLLVCMLLPFLETLLDRILFTSRNLCRQGILL